MNLDKVQIIANALGRRYGEEFEKYRKEAMDKRDKEDDAKPSEVK